MASPLRAAAPSVSSAQEMTMPAVYTLTETARLFGISTTSVEYTYLNYGKIRVIHTPNGRYLQAEDVEQVYAQRQARAAALAALSTADLYTVAQAIAHLGVDRATFWKWVHAGKLHPITIPHSRATYYHREAIHHCKQERQAMLDAARVLPDDAYTAKQVSHLLGIGKSTVLTWGKKGTLARRWLPQCKTYVYPKAEVDAVAQAQAQQAPPEVKGPPEPEAFAQLYAAVWQLPDDAQPQQACRMVRYLTHRYHISGTDAADILQQVFVHLWEEGSTFFARYPTLEDQRLALYRRCQWQFNADRDTARAQKSAQDRFAAEWMHTRVPQVEEQVIAREQCQAVLDAAKQYPVKHQRILVMLGQGFTETEIVKALAQEGIITSGHMVQRYKKDLLSTARQVLSSWHEHNQ